MAVPREQTTIIEQAPAKGFIQLDIAKPEEALEAWMGQGRLYAIIDGLNQPSLAGLAEVQQPKVNTALYSYCSDAEQLQISPHIIRVDQAVYDWLGPVIEQEVQWGWFMLPRRRYQQWPFTYVLAKLLEHFRISSIAPSRSEGTNSYFRLQDPQAILRWLELVSKPSIPALFGPLESLLIGNKSQLTQLQPEPQQAEVGLQLPPAPWPAAVFNALEQQIDGQQLAQYREYLHKHHTQVQAWEAKALRQFIIDNNQAAKDLGFDNPYMVVQYLSLSVELGPDFIERKDGQWARKSLSHTQQQEAGSRLEHLMTAAYQYMDQ